MYTRVPGLEGVLMRKSIMSEKSAITVHVEDVDSLRADLDDRVHVDVEPETSENGLRRMVVSHPDGTTYELTSEDSLR